MFACPRARRGATRTASPARRRGGCSVLCMDCAGACVVCVSVKSERARTRISHSTKVRMSPRTRHTLHSSDSTVPFSPFYSQSHLESRGHLAFFGRRPDRTCHVVARRRGWQACCTHRNMRIGYRAIVRLRCRPGGVRACSSSTSEGNQRETLQLRARRRRGCVSIDCARDSEEWRVFGAWCVPEGHAA